MQFVLRQTRTKKKILVDNGVCSVFAERICTQSFSHSVSIFWEWFKEMQHNDGDHDHRWPWWWWWLPEQQRTIYLIYLGCKAHTQTHTILSCAMSMFCAPSMFLNGILRTLSQQIWIDHHHVALWTSILIIRQSSKCSVQRFHCISKIVSFFSFANHFNFYLFIMFDMLCVCVCAWDFVHKAKYWALMDKTLLFYIEMPNHENKYS